MATSSGRLLKFFLLTLTIIPVISWDTDDFEIFDLIEEVNRNFYEVLDVDHGVTTSELRKAYRKLSLQLHPDKNKAPDADVQFRQMVAVYEVLKDEEKRQRYDRVLVEGLPDWRQPVFYYRRVRKMGIMEMTGLLAVILTIGQYLVAWAIYFEKRLSLEDFYASKKKLVESKNKKKSKIGVEELEEVIEEELKSLPQPRILDLWMFRLPGFLLYMVQMMPTLLVEVKEYIRSRRQVPQEEEEEESDGDNEPSRKVRRKKIEIPEYQAVMYQKAAPGTVRDDKDMNDEIDNKQKKCGEWSEEELILLAKAVNKFPGGTANRWDKIAEFVGRSVEEVTLKSKQAKGGSYSMNLSSNVQGGSLTGKTKKREWEISDKIISTTFTSENTNKTEVETARKRNVASKLPKTAEGTAESKKDKSASENSQVTNSQKGNVDSAKVKVSDETWTQNQQMIFEWALKHTPKSVDKRWEKIAEQIPGKSKEECILRFKYLADLVKKKKLEEQKS